MARKIQPLMTQKITKRSATKMREELSAQSGTALRDDAIVVWYNNKPRVALILTPDNTLYNVKHNQADRFIETWIKG